MTEFTSPLTVDGVPVNGNGIPTTFGNYFYVDADGGDDANDGKSMKTAKKTVLAGYNLMASGNNDVLILSAAGAHAITAELAVAKNNVHFVGLGVTSRYFGQGTRLEMSSGGSANSGIILNTGKRNSFSNIKFFNLDSSTSFAVVDAGEFSQWSHCEMLNGQNLSTVTDAHLLCEADSGYYVRCSIGSTQQGHGITGARGNVLFTRGIVSGKACRDSVFEDCLFPLYAASTAALQVKAVNANDIERMLLFRRCVFYTSAASSANQVDAITFDAALTVGDLLLEDCIVHGAAGIVVDSTGVFQTTRESAFSDVSAVSIAAGT